MRERDRLRDLERDRAIGLKREEQIAREQKKRDDEIERVFQ